MPRASILAGWIEKQVGNMVETCSTTPADLDYAIQLLLEAQPNRTGRGRPRSRKVNGPRLRTLRKKAGMTQMELVAAIKEHTKLAGAFNLKTLQRYERSESGERSNLEAITTVLRERLSRNPVLAIAAEEIAF